MARVSRWVWIVIGCALIFVVVALFPEQTIGAWATQLGAATAVLFLLVMGLLIISPLIIGALALWWFIRRRKRQRPD